MSSKHLNHTPTEKKECSAFQAALIIPSVEGNRGCPSLQHRLDRRTHGAWPFLEQCLEVCSVVFSSRAFCDVVSACQVSVRFCAHSSRFDTTCLFQVPRPTQFDVESEWRQNSKEQQQLELRSPPTSSLVGWHRWLAAGSGLDLTLTTAQMAGAPLKGPWRTELCR